MNSRAKGARIEREAAKALEASLNVDARRSVQFCGRGGDADLQTTLEGVHFEVKGRAKHSVLRFYEQAEEDAKKTSSIPVVLLRENGDPNFYLLLRLDDLRTVAEKVAVIGEKP
jgi:hypothetical protein